MLDGFLMKLVSEDKFGREIANLLELVAYSAQLGDVVVVITPESDTPVLFSHREYSTVD